MDETNGTPGSDPLPAAGPGGGSDRMTGPRDDGAEQLAGPPDGGVMDGGVTGDRPVDGVLSGLGRVAELPVAGHAAVYAELHDGLLAALNEDPAESFAADGGSAGTGPGVAAPGLPHRGRPGVPQRPAPRPEAG